MEKRETSNRYEWGLERGLTYLNHGSFGPAPVCVQEVREAWSRHIQSNPMQFFFSELEPALDNVIDRLGEFVRADSRNIVLVENATVAMNAVAETIELNSGDEVLLNDHEYGAVFNIWRRVCERSGARIVSISLGKSKELDRDDNHSKTMSDEKFVVLERRTDRKLMSSDEIIREIADGISPKTKLIVLSHVTSPTAIVFPVKDVCRMAREKKVPVCIDGPHAIAMCDVDLRKIECDFYCASLHKWLSAPFGAGFLFAHPRWHSRMTSAVTSWGRSLSGRSKNWKDQFHWLGTRDPSAFLAIPAAIDFLTRFGWDRFRQQTHELAQYARHRLEAILQTEASIPDSIEWYGSMTAIPLSGVWDRLAVSVDTGKDESEPNRSLAKSSRKRPNAIHPLQLRLHQDHHIEIPVTDCRGQKYLRVSCHLYNDRSDIDRLVAAIKNYQDELNFAGAKST